MAIMNTERLLWSGLRKDANDSDMWQVPQGGIDHGESPYDAMLRELVEEIGTNKVNVLSESSEWLRYDVPKDIANSLWGGLYIGQKQKWFLLEFLGSDEDVKIQSGGGIEQEFVQWKWSTPDELLSNIIEFKTDVYRAAFKEFGLI